MKLKTIYKTFVYAIVVIAYCVIIYKLATYDNYGTLFDQFVSNISTNWMYLVLCLLLMPCNMLTEAVKWQCAVRHIEKISFKKAIISTLRGQVGGIATPNKLGDIPTRALSLKDCNKATGIIMGFIAAWTLSFVIIIIGAITSYVYFSTYFVDFFYHEDYFMLLTNSCILIIILIISPLFLKFLRVNKIKSDNIRTTLTTLSHTPYSKVVSLIGLSLLRYAIFCLQLFLMFLFFDISITFAQACVIIPTIYLFTTITPTLMTSEATTRSAYAIFLLSPICHNSEPTIALATSLLWALNCGTPIIIGSFLFNKHK